MSLTKSMWLKRILAVKVILTFLLWAVPPLFFPISWLQRLGVPAPEDPLFLRLFGAVVMALGVAYWFAYKDPFQNAAILKAGIVDNGLVTLIILYFIFFSGLRNIVFLISAPLTFFFFIAFIVLMPKSKAA